MVRPISGARPSGEDFTAFVTAWTDQLLRTAYLLCRDFGEAEDLVQETWVRVARNWHRVGRMDAPLAYTRKVLVNLAIGSGPARGRRRAQLPLDPDGPTERPVVDARADRALRTVDDHDQLGWLLAALTPRQRGIVVLRYWAGLSERETAEAVGCSVGTVKSTASRALAQLRDAADAADRGRPSAATPHTRGA